MCELLHSNELYTLICIMYYTYVQIILYYMCSFNFYIHNVHKDFPFNEEKNVNKLALSLSVKKETIDFDERN